MMPTHSLVPALPAPAGTPVITPEEYIERRLDDQIDWYRQRSRSNHAWFKRLRVVELLFASTLPFLVSQISSQTPLLRIAGGAMGVSIAVISGLLSLYRFNENWLEYRTAAEALKHEKFLFLTRTPPYDGEAAFRTLVTQVEALLTQENAKWSRSLREKPEEKPPS
jgi:hypothetical protein